MTAEIPFPPARRRSPRFAIALVVLLIIGGAATALVWNLMTPTDRPSGAVVFHIERTPRTLLPTRGETGPDEFDAYRQAQVALVRSRRVLNSAINEPEAKNTNLIRTAEPDPLTWLESSLRVSSSQLSSSMLVEMDGDDPAEVLVVLNALSKAYLAISLERDNSAQSNRLSELERAYSKCQANLEQKQATLARLGELTGNGGSSALLHNRSADELAEELRLARAELRRLRLERALFEANPPPTAQEVCRSPLIAVGGSGAVIVDSRATRSAPRHSRP